MCRWLLLVTLAVVTGCAKPAPPTRLQPSGTTGLLGAPLPTGARLIDQRAGDPVTGRDSGEHYSISASADEILAFFEQAMVAAGWERTDQDTRSSRVFQKGDIEIVVVTNIDGGMFILSVPSADNENRKSNAETTFAKRHSVVKLTPAAIARFHDAQQQDGKPYVRVRVVSGGSTGFMYDLKFDDQIDVENDYFDQVEGLQIVVDKRSALFVDGATIDWQTTEDGQQGFHFDNPNAVK